MRFLCRITLALFFALQGGVAAAETSDFDETKQLAEQGNAVAQSNLGVVYALGEGVRKDFTIADMWFVIAARNGDGSGAAARDMLALELTDAAIAKAQEMARVCLGSDSRDCGVK